MLLDMLRMSKTFLSICVAFRMGIFLGYWANMLIMKCCPARVGGPSFVLGDSDFIMTVFGWILHPLHNFTCFNHKAKPFELLEVLGFGCW